MAQQARGQFGYETVQLIKTEPLGTGSYGAVYKARCDDLLCAGKILHPTLFQSSKQGQMTIMRQFQQECRFLSAIRHPNIVQYLGSHQDTETQLPVLLMELMDKSLTLYLENSQEPLLYHTQVDICHDIALALAYLHSNNIIHRDLSSNNVLLIGAGIRAKVTDFGMAKLFQTNFSTMTPQTRCPGTLVYMSPESLDDPPVYTQKLDTFSFGVLIIQIITRLFPNPGPRTKKIENPHDPKHRLQEVVSETERRKSHIALINPTYPLLLIATDCLSYIEEDRPSAQELCHQLTKLKEGLQYSDSVQQAKVGSRPAQSVTENRGNREGQVRELNWKMSKPAPCRMRRGSAAVCDSMAYFRALGISKVHAYNSDTEEWSTLPDCLTDYFTLAIVQSLVTAVGGKQSGKCTNTLLSLVNAGGKKKWVEHFPPMPTKRIFTVVVCSGNTLVVAGGKGEGYTTLTTVEVMNTDTLQWSKTSSLPHPLTQASATACGDRVYLLGGLDQHGRLSQSVFTCSLSALLQSQTAKAKMKSFFKAGNSSVWHMIAHLPVFCSTGATLNGKLLAVGGNTPEEKDTDNTYATNNIYNYNTETNTWEVISHMPTPRRMCLVVVLPRNKLMVVGGRTDSCTDTKKVEIASLM